MNMQWTPQEDAQLWALSARGLTKQKTAEIIGRSKASVARRAGILRIQFNPLRAWTAEDDAYLLELAAAGKSCAESAVILNRTRGALREHARLRGVCFKKRRQPISANKILRNAFAPLPREKKLKPPPKRTARRPSSPWTAALEQAVMQDWKMHLSARSIAKKYEQHGITRMAVIGRMHRLGLSHFKKDARPAGKPRTRPRKAVPPQVKPRAPKNNNPSGFKGIHLKDIRYHYVGHRNSEGAPLPLKKADDVARISHTELEHKHCKWVVGDPDKIGANAPLFCGEPRHAHLPYCAGHCRRAYRPA